MNKRQALIMAARRVGKSYGQGKLSEAERAAESTPIEKAFRALRTGVASDEDWRVMHNAVRVGQAVSEAVTPGLKGHLTEALCALQALHRRTAGRTSYPVPHLGEVETLETAVEMLCMQFGCVTRQQLRAAKLGAPVFPVHQQRAEAGSAQRQEQLAL